MNLHQLFKLANFFYKKSHDFDLGQYNLANIDKGSAVTAYHGTTSYFDSFDESKARRELVDKFYGPGLFFTTSKKAARSYANANRNIGFPTTVIDDLKKINPEAGNLMQNLYENGWGDFYKKVEEGVEEKGPEIFWQDMNNLMQGLDINDIADVCRNIIGSKIKTESANEEPINIFNMSTGMPAYVYNLLDDIGIDSFKYRPKVYTVEISGIKNPLITSDQEEARHARELGHDAIIYYGPNIVGGHPEVAVFDPNKISIKDIELAN